MYNRREPEPQYDEDENRRKYWERREELLDAGMTPYNCDELDEFPPYR